MQFEKQKPSLKPTKRTYRSKLEQPKKSFQTSTEIDIRVSEVIERINEKMNRAKIQTLHPPYFQKTLTKFRQESYSYKLKGFIDNQIANGHFETGRNLLRGFIVNFDDENIDFYVEQIREPYTRKIFNESYEIDKVNFKKLNSEYELRKEISDVINETSEWLIQMEVCEDLLNRINLYFNVPYQPIIEHLKNQGAECRNGSWFSSFGSLIKKTSSYTLKKSSRIVQNSAWAACVSPAFAMLTWAIIGGNGNIPWTGGIDAKAIITPIIAFSIPYILDNIAEKIERSDFQTMLVNWTEQFEAINSNIRSFNRLLEKEINACADASNRLTYEIHVTNLTKYVDNLLKDVTRVSKYDEKTFEEMRERTKAYFMEYVEIQEGDWITVLTPEEYQKRKAEIEAHRLKSEGKSGVTAETADCSTNWDESTIL